MQCLRLTANCRSIILPREECLTDFRNPRGSRYAKLCQAGGRVFARVMRTVMISIGIPVSARLAVRFCGLRFPAASCSVISRSRVFKGKRGVCLRARSLTEGFFSPLSAQTYISGFSFSFDFKVKYRGNHRVRECMSCEMLCEIRCVAHASPRIWINLFSRQCRDSRGMVPFKSE